MNCKRCQHYNGKTTPQQTVTACGCVVYHPCVVATADDITVECDSFTRCYDCKWLLGGNPEHYIEGWHCKHREHISDAYDEPACDKFIAGDNIAGLTQVD